MPLVSITRGPSAVTLTRGDVQPGQVFAVPNKDGKLGKNYAAIGMNGRQYSINLATSELASSDKPERKVTLTGSWTFRINRNPAPSVVRECKRSEVRPGEVFHAKGKDTLYANLGKITRAMEGYLSVPIARSENHAVTRNGNGTVFVIGTFVMDATVAS